MKELIQLIKMLFGAKPADAEVELVKMSHFPFKGYRFMMWCGKLIYRSDNETRINYLKETGQLDVSINHEKIHLEQAKIEGTWFKFYRKYLWWWIKGNPLWHPAVSAYYTIPYEMEAYANQENLDYPESYDGSNLAKYIIKKRKSTYHAHAKNFAAWLRDEFNTSINL